MKNTKKNTKDLAWSAFCAALLSTVLAVIFIAAGASVAVGVQIWILCEVLFTIVFQVQLSEIPGDYED